MKFRITNADTSAVTAYLQKLSPAKEYDVTVAVHKAQRSIPQNKLYWCWVALICEETGADRDEVHTELKRRYLPSESVVGLYGDRRWRCYALPQRYACRRSRRSRRQGCERWRQGVRLRSLDTVRPLSVRSSLRVRRRVIKRPISTSKLNTAQFTAYLEKVQVLASSELGIVLPVPEDRIFEEFYEQYENRI